MTFIKVPGLEGKVYVPETNLEIHKKHPCKDCFSCQMCTDNRCILCREQKHKECVQEKFCKIKSQAGNK
jgi:hypothetical protein